MEIFNNLFIIFKVTYPKFDSEFVDCNMEWQTWEYSIILLRYYEFVIEYGWYKLFDIDRIWLENLNIRFIDDKVSNFQDI